ncbi:ABC transporter ATP-binding protein [Muricauda sp. SCSIO 64092]|uniref:ABC transporter ATP-binding protein n=1 Tax=Allomuricauda sp. SCSIO 64092 TaxID=2908842 RepID=UPI001FF1B6FA|nr:ABC transporter ATP-binding protein [Muricauda sp. SCSIO 64092]UOY07946.1 ABC transporter ATP-binding protein [Muricauda sp. SCSIO 64092]
MIQITDLHKKFGKNEVLKGLDLTIEPGRIYAILGPNGSGKTTLIKSILGMVLPDKGKIEVLGKPIEKGWKYRKQIDYLPQIANFPGNLKVRELIKMIKDLRNDEGNEELLITTFSLQPHLDKKLSNLSGGTKQKVNLVLAFMFNSQLLILDEPNTGLDPNALIKLKELISKEKANGKTLLITSHVMQFVEEVADEIVYLLEGTIYFKGTIAALKKVTNQQNVEHAIAELTKTEQDG